MGWLSNLVSKGLDVVKGVGGQVLTNVGTNVANNVINRGTQAVTNAITGGNGASAAPAGGGGFDWRGIIAGALPVASALQQRDLPYQKELEGIGYGALDMAKMMTPTAMANMQGIIGGPAMGAIDTNLARQQAQIRQTYNQMGMSGSTAEAQDLASAGRDAVSQQYELGRQMASSGFQGIAAQTGIADTTFSNLMQMQLAQDQELQDALQAYAALFAGGGAQPQQPTGGGGATSSSDLTDIINAPPITVNAPTVPGANTPYTGVGTVNTGPLTLPAAGATYPGVGVVNTGPLTLPAAGSVYGGTGGIDWASLGLPPPPVGYNGPIY